MAENTNTESGGEVPSLIKDIASNKVAGFDKIGMNADFQVFILPPQDSEVGSTESNIDEPKVEHSISVIMPRSFEEDQLKNNKSVVFSGELDVEESNSASLEVLKPAKFHSQPIPKEYVFPEASSAINYDRHPSIKVRSKDNGYNSFKTWSGKLERQLTILRGKTPKQPMQDAKNGVKNNDKPLPVDRYYDALQGPELETLKDSEEILLPHDKKWPFLLRFPISSFGICLGVGSQAILWKTLATATSTQFLHISLEVNLILWFMAIALVASISSIYLLKIILYYEAVRREYYHPIRVNFFFAPWIALLFLALGAPPSLVKNLHHILWYILMFPILCLELKIYGQWMSGSQRRLSKVANPSNHLSIVGNFVGALLGASMGLKEGPLFFFAIGFAHYTVLFVTLYQRLPTTESLPKDLHPVFFLFVAAPSVASMAWAKIQGSFDYGSRISYFIAMFLFFSLVVRVNFFTGFKFSLAWWAYTFPMSAAAIATIRYTEVVTNVGTKSLCVFLSLVSTITVSLLFVTTMLHAFVFRDLFPNDNAIAISDRKRKPHHISKWFHLGLGSDDLTNEIENYLKFTHSDSNKELEVPNTNNNSKNSTRVFPKEN